MDMYKLRIYSDEGKFDHEEKQEEANEKERVKAIREEEQKQIDLIKKYCEKEKFVIQKVLEILKI